MSKPNARRRSPRNHSKGSAWGGFLILLCGISLLGAVLLSVGGYQLYASQFPNVAALKSQYPIVIYKGPKQPFEMKLQKGRPGEWASLGEISREAVGAIIVSEDWAFYQHDGYDPNQIKEAIKGDLEEGRFHRGASTITQQVVKNVFLTSEKTIWRKLKELYLAVRLEDTVGKRKILETYLNIAEWGEGVFGIRAAARHYFGKSPAELTAKEGAFLAMLLPSPKRYSQSFHKKQLTTFANRSIESILLKMQQAHYLSEEQRLAEMTVPLSFEAPSTPEGTTPGMSL